MNIQDNILTLEDCNIILNKYFTNSDFKLIKYSVVPLSNNVECFLDEQYIIEVEVEINSDIFPVSFIAKIPPFKHDLQMEVTRTSYSFEKEIFFYKVLLKDFEVYCLTFDFSIVPIFFYSRSNELIVMENLQKKFCAAGVEDYIDLKHLKIVLKALAKLHSASIIYEEKKSVEIGKPFRLIDKYEEFLEEAFFRSDLGYKWHKASQTGILAIIDLMPNISTNEFKNKFYHLSEECINIKPSKKFRNVLSHGDLQINNTLFRYENGIPVQCKLTNFQFMKYTPPAFDVLKIIYQTSPEMRKHNFEDLLKYYYDNLCKELTLGDVVSSEVLSWNEFYASVRYVLPHCKIETSYYYSNLKFSPEFLNLLHNCEDFNNFIDRTPSMLQYYIEGSVYKKWMDDILLDIKDMLLNHGFTREDCYVILKRKLNTTDFYLQNYFVNKVDKKSGFMGEHLKIKMNINYKNDDIKLTFFVKTLPESAFKNFVSTSGAFSNEIFMFQEFFSKMALLGMNEIYNCVPRCYFAQNNDLLVFEDLNELGFKTVDKFKPLSLDEISVVIKKLAAIHGGVLIMEEKLSICKEFRVEKEFINDLLEIDYVKTEGHLGLDGIRAGIKGVHTMVDLYPDSESKISSTQFKEIISKLYDNTMYDLAGPSKKYRNVICHGDLWASNIMIKYKSHIPVDCRIVDFQCVRICPPAHDLMSLIHLTTSRTFRSNYMSDVIQLYHGELRNILKKHDLDIENIIPLETFLESCEIYQIFAINQAATLFPAVMMASKGVEDLLSDDEFCFKTNFVDRSDFIRDAVNKDEQYKHIVGESMKDLRNLCEKLIENGSY